jgi:hypothetical protein
MESIKMLAFQSSVYKLWTREAAQKRLAFDPNVSKGSVEAFDPYFKQFTALLLELRAYAKKEFE